MVKHDRAHAAKRRRATGYGILQVRRAARVRGAAPLCWRWLLCAQRKRQGAEEAQEGS